MVKMASSRQIPAPTSRRKGRWAGAGGCLRLREDPLLDLDEEEVVRRPPDEEEAERFPPDFFCDVAIVFEILSQDMNERGSYAAGTRVKPVRLSTRNTPPAIQQ